MNLNKVFLIGRLTADPEKRMTTIGIPVANTSLATNKVYTDKAGKKMEKAEFHNIVAYGRLAEVMSGYCHKGSLIYVEGRLQTRRWTDKKTNEIRKTTEIIVENIQFGPKTIIDGVGSGGGESEPAGLPKKELTEEVDFSTEDLPF